MARIVEAENENDTQRQDTPRDGINIVENPLDRQDSAQSAPVQTPTSDQHTSRQGWKSFSSRASKSVKKKTARVFKVNEDEEQKKLWDDRRKRLIHRTCSKTTKKMPSVIGDDVIDSFHTSDDVCDGIVCRKPALKVALNGVSRATGSIRRKLQRPSGETPVPGEGPTEEPLTGKSMEETVDEADNIPDFLTPDQIQGLDPDRFDDHRPFFTFYMITAQTLIMIIALLAYGLGPIGFNKKVHSDKILVTSLSRQQVDFNEPTNLWIGPPAAALIHLGAKYTPCMRHDKHVMDNIQQERDEERESGCCIRNDESGCVQTTKERCSDILSTWKKWTPEKPGPSYRQYSNNSRDFVIRNRVSGSVCGQDPRFCNLPASRPPYEWPDDITQWPVCLEFLRPRLSEEHMSCEIIGRPCCIGIYGECRITTQEYCQFVDGYFHEEATLCSQVSCMDDVCGLVPFINEEVPDQWYRVFTSLFLHAGLIHLAFSLLFYYYFMMNIERMVGPLRTAVIYISSGIGGNLASAAFVPYRAEVGPAGSILGMMGCLIVLICYSRKDFDSEEEFKNGLLRYILITVIFLTAGLFLPWIDNYAHIGGFVVGVFVSLICVPYLDVKSGYYDARRKKIVITAGIILLPLVTVALALLLYVFPIYSCSWCKYLNCFFALFSDELCPDQDIKITRVDVL